MVYDGLSNLSFQQSLPHRLCFKNMNKVVCPYTQKLFLTWFIIPTVVITHLHSTPCFLYLSHCDPFGITSSEKSFPKDVSKFMYQYAPLDAVYLYSARRRLVIIPWRKQPESLVLPYHSWKEKLDNNHWIFMHFWATEAILPMISSVDMSKGSFVSCPTLGDGLKLPIKASVKNQSKFFFFCFWQLGWLNHSSLCTTHSINVA
jgi:hypothetical protein